MKKFKLLEIFPDSHLEKNCYFARFCRKIKINRDLVGMLRNFTDTSIKIHIEDVQSFVAF